MPASLAVLSANLRVLEQGLELLGRLSPALYAGSSPGSTAAGKPVGPHFRHILEHYSCFLSGLPSGRIDYDSRAREAQLERDPEAARERIRELIGGLTLVASQDLEAGAEIRLESGQGEETDQWSRSTLRRELQFLLSHTVHHFALIGLLLGQLGVDAGPDFGVAPSTLKHWRSQPSCAPQPG